MKDFLTDVITKLAGETPEILITNDDTGAVVNIKVSHNISRVVGKNGKTIDAIRILTRAIGYNGSHHIMITLDRNDEIPKYI